MRGFGAVLRKEWTQMFRDQWTLRMAFVIPIFELILFGLIDTNVRHVPTAVFDESRTRESRELIQALKNTSYFDIRATAVSAEDLRQKIVSGKVSVGVQIPPDFARRRLNNQPADFQVLIDGSDSSISSQTLSAAAGVAFAQSLQQLQAVSFAKIQVKNDQLIVMQTELVEHAGLVESGVDGVAFGFQRLGKKICKWRVIIGQEN